MTKATLTEKNLTFSFKNTEFTDLDVLADVDMRQGTPVDETDWLKGYGGTYPGGLSGFNASNTDGSEAGSLRLITLQFDVETANAEVLVITAGVSKILSIVGSTMPTADKTLSIAFTNTGDDADPPTKTGGTLPAIEVHAEAAVDGATVTFLAF